MTYSFPPPGWFEIGSTSFTLLVIALWGIAVSLPASILACWIWASRSKVLCALAMLYWAIALLTGLVVNATLMGMYLFRDAPPVLALVTSVMLIVLPLPALAAGWEQLLADRMSSRGFRDVRTWGCASPFSFLLFLYFMVPSLIHPPEASNRSQFKYNLKDIGRAMHDFHDAERRFPDGRSTVGNAHPKSWRVELLPYLKHQAEFGLYDPTQVWDSDANGPLARRDLKLYACPSVPSHTRQDSAGRCTRLMPL